MNEEDAVEALKHRLPELIKHLEDEGLDHDLVAAFERLLIAEEDSTVLSSVLARIDRLPQSVSTLVEAPTASQIPAGQFIHRGLAVAMRRRDTALLAQVQTLAEETRACLLDLADIDFGVLGRRLDRIAADAEAAADAVGETVRELAGVRQSLEIMETRLTKLEAADRPRHFRPWFSELDFGAEFRGQRTEILDRYHDVADMLAQTGGPVLDLGCGRGELLELVKARDVPARGVEVDPELVDFCSSLSLDVSLLDAESALDEQGDDSLGGVALIQVVEHLTPQQLVETIPLLFRKLRPGGVAIAETVNATSPFVYTRSFYLDPTHTNPIHPDYLAFLFRKAGFRSVEIQWKSLVPEEERLSAVRIRPAKYVMHDADDSVADQQSSEALDASKPSSDPEKSSPSDELTELGNQINDRLLQLNRFLFAPQDYLVVAKK